MSRYTLMALAISSVLSCASFAQDQAAKPQPAPSASTAGSQSSAPAPSSKPTPNDVISNKTMESMIRAQILDYSRDKNVKKESLKIVTVNGIPFDDVMRVFVWSGSVAKGGTTTFAFPGSAVVVSGIEDGRGGFKAIQKIDIADGTRVQLKAGGTYVLDGGRWKKTTSVGSQTSNLAKAARPSEPPSAPAPPPPPPPAPATLPSTSVVPLTEPVLTLKGACRPKPGTTTSPEGCVSSLTREQFEKLVQALTPPDRPAMPPDVLRKFADQYAKLLTFSDAARAMGMENDPRVLQIMQYTKNQILTEALNLRITEEYSHPTDQQIEDYYKQNSKKYEEVTLQRIMLPRNQGNADKPKPSEAEEKAYVDQIQQRWVAGEDPEKLEKEAAEHAGVTTPAANVNFGPRSPGSLPEAHEAVFDLQPGQVSQAYSDPAFFYIYKVVSVRTIPLSEAKAKINTTLQRQLVTDKIQEIQSSVTPVLNDAYFGPEKPSAPPTPRIITPRRGMPPAPGAGAPPPQNPPVPPQ